MSADGYLEMTTAGRVLPRAPRSRSEHQCPVRRDSMHVSQAAAWCAAGKLSAVERRQLRSWEFEEWLRSQRRHGAVRPSQAASWVIKKLIGEMDYDSGFLQVAYRGLALVAGLASSTVQIIVGQLVKLGVLEKLRLCEEGDDPDGPPWVQAMNAYRLKVPAAFLAWLETRARPKSGPTPVDHAHAAKAAAKRNGEHQAEWYAWLFGQERASRREAAVNRPVYGPGAEAVRARRRLE